MKTTFQEHHNEIRRRSEMSRQGLIDSKSFTKVEDSGAYNFLDLDQKFFVFSLSQKSFAPIPVDTTNPAICIYGAFPTRDEAVEFARDSVMAEHGNISVFVDQIHEWIVAVKDVESLSESYTKAHREKLLAKHQKMLHTNLKEFEENVAEQKAGDAELKSEQKTDSASEDAKPKGKSHKISNRLDVRGQRVAVVSFVKDDAEVPEFLFRIYGFFEKADDANAYIRNVCGEKVEDYDIDVVGTCEWVFPQHMTHENVSNEIFRSEELDKIMRNHRNQPKEVAKFKEAMKDDERYKDDVDVSDVSDDATSKVTEEASKIVEKE